MTTSTTHIDGRYDEKFSISPTCIVMCGAACKSRGWFMPICIVNCLFHCKDTPTVSEVVRVCTSTCAQSNCSKFIKSGN